MSGVAVALLDRGVWRELGGGLHVAVLDEVLAAEGLGRELAEVAVLDEVLKGCGRVALGGCPVEDGLELSDGVAEVEEVAADDD